jgi:hypothetical protein
MSTQIAASIAGAIGTKNAALYHSRRGRNLWLFAFAIAIFGCFWVQTQLIVYTAAEYKSRDQCVQVESVEHSGFFRIFGTIGCACHFQSPLLLFNMIIVSIL